MPIIATRASAAYGAGFAAVTGPAPYLGPFGAFDALASTTLTATTASVTFAGIPLGYKHLQIRAIAKSAAVTSGYDYVHATFNGDASANYSLHYLYGNGASALVSGNTGLNYARLGNLSQNGLTSVFGVSIVDIYDYSSTTKNKTVKSLSGHEGNTGNTDGVVHFYTSAWFNTSSPITAITLFPQTNSFVALSSFALYGVK